MEKMVFVVKQDTELWSIGFYQALPQWASIASALCCSTSMRAATRGGVAVVTVYKPKSKKLGGRGYTITLTKMMKYNYNQ